MIDKITQITANGKTYPAAFTLNIVESIQEKYGSLDKWSEALEPESTINSETGEEIKPEPNIKDVIWTFQEFINEGIDIENEDSQNKREFLTHKQVGRIISDIGLAEIGKVIRNMATSQSSGEEKNPMTTQN